MKMSVRMHRSNIGWDFELVVLMLDHEGRAAYIAKPIKLEFEPLKPGTRIEHPTLTLDRVEGEEFLTAMAEALQRENIKPPEPHRLEGEIDATKRHLEDLRTLLKLRKP